MFPIGGEVAIKARKVQPVGRGPKPNDLPRVCTDEACEVVLSRYNPGTLCAAQQPLRYPRVRGKNAKR